MKSFLYQGQYYDFETKLAYNRFRYYSPKTGIKRCDNISDVLLKFQQLTNQYNTKELPYYFPLPTIEISVFKPIMVLDSFSGSKRLTTKN